MVPGVRHPAEREVTRLPPARRIASSIAFAAAAGFLLGGLVMSVGFLAASRGEPIGTRILLAVMGLLYYGPALLLTGWPVALPVIAALGFALAFVPQRMPPIARGVLLGYAGILALTWLVLLLS